MNCTVRNKRNNGFTLVEMIVVMSIIGILGAIAVPSFIGYTEKAKEEVCRVNCLQVERMYEGYLMLENNEHSDEIFNQYMNDYRKDICPNHGDVSYVDGKVRCSIHSKENDSESDEEDVPFL
jgi:prepilin-type N-terminal cleavage/methylation domain-containing protein